MSSRQDYIHFLEKKGLKESDVLPLWPEEFEKEKNSLLLELFLQLKEDETTAPTVQKVFETLQKNTNDLIQVMDLHLREQLAAGGIKNIPQTYVGVFPLNGFNGQAVNGTNGPLILLKTGCFELLEAASNFFIAERNNQERVRLLSNLIIDFCEKDIIPSTKSIDHPSFRGEAQLTAVNLVSQSECFVLCHEYGHLMKGHFDAAHATTLQTRKGAIDAFTHIRRKEYEADFWAIEAMVQLGRQTNIPLSQVRCGILFFFCIVHLIETYLHRLGSFSDGHPSAIERISHAEQLLLVYGAHDNALWNFITTAHLSFFNLVNHQLFGTTLPWQKMSLVPPNFK